MQRIRYFLIYFKHFFSIKLVFKKPSKKEILLFDYIFDDYMKKVFKNKVEVLYLRLESLNIFIIYKVFFKHGLRNFSTNYILTYIDYVSPKVLLTFSDTHPTFYLLRNYLKSKKILTIAVQIGFRTNKNFVNFDKKNKYSSSFSCIFADSYSSLYSRYINSKKVIVGSLKNNYFKKIKKKNSNKIFFISQFKPEFKTTNIQIVKREEKILKYLELYCTKNKINLFVATKPTVTKKDYISHFKIGKNFSIISGKNPNDLLGNEYKTKYNLLDSSELTVFIDSTLGLESLSRGNKVLSYPMKPYQEFKTNSFWLVNSEKNDFFKKLSTVYKMSNKEWIRKVKNNQFLLLFNPGNKKLFKIIKKAIK